MPNLTSYPTPDTLASLFAPPSLVERCMTFHACSTVPRSIVELMEITDMGVVRLSMTLSVLEADGLVVMHGDPSSCEFRLND